MPRSTLRTVVLTLSLAALAAAAGTGLFVYSGAYDVSADRQHLQIVHSAMEATMRQSVRRRARTIEERPLHTPGLVERGAVCFRSHCVACHGAPGVAPDMLGLALQPLPGPLVDAPAHWRPRELVWIVRHGIRMSGMPAWQHRLADDDIWALAALMNRLPQLSTADWRSLERQVEGQACALVAPSAASVDGLAALKRHACHGCHVIPGVVGSLRMVGPPLDGYARRSLIAGRLPNTPANLAAWIRDPQAIAPGSAMPPTGVGEADAQAIAHYLLSLR